VYMSAVIASTSLQSASKVLDILHRVSGHADCVKDVDHCSQWLCLQRVSGVLGLVKPAMLPLACCHAAFTVHSML
jgi:hypothetical protein